MAENPSTGIVRDTRYLDHRPEAGHPECPQRLASIHEALDESDLMPLLTPVSPRPARSRELLWIHSEDHIRRLEATSDGPIQAISSDTQTSGESYRTARLAAGGLFEAIRQVVEGRLANAFALVRPPGHHAEKSRAMGYCLLNNVALGAAFARRQLGLERVLIVDWDVHHGNGTQHAFEDDPDVLFFSMHQYPLFPGTGHYTETGRGRGEGFTVNLPLPRGCGDGEYTLLLETLLKPMARQFCPDLILVSAGFDTHRSDPIGAMKMSCVGFAWLTRTLMDIAEDCGHGRLVLCLEGGYHLGALGNGVATVLAELAGKTRSDLSRAAGEADQRKVAYVLKRAGSVHRRFWRSP
jgi:acetoin utilization deacetylase AcuC-like enzyme